MPLAILIVDIVADLLVNLAAGWFGVVLVIPFTFPALSLPERKQNAIVLLSNIAFGMMAVVTATLIRYLVI